jgi:hypothetical protein
VLRLLVLALKVLAPRGSSIHRGDEKGQMLYLL